MKASELREKSVQDLTELIDERRRELFDLRFKHYTGQLLDTASLKKARRDVARIETVIRQIENANTAEA
jgi:large subunit ribosomal protein L29